MNAGGIGITMNSLKINDTYSRDFCRQADLIPDERLALIATALIMEILDRFFKDMSDSWEIITEKSRKWLEEKIAHFNPEIKSRPLKDFISGYILKIKMFKYIV